MSDSMTIQTPTQLRQLGDKLQEPDWLQSRREQAWKQFVSMEVTRLEKTDISRRSWDVGSWSDDESDIEISSVGEILDASTEYPTVYVRDGWVQSVSLPESLSAQGIIFTDLHTASRQYGDLVKKHLGTVVPDDQTKWTAVNTSLWRGGVFLYVPRNIQVEVPFLFVSSQLSQSGGAFGRVLVVGEEGSQFSITEVCLASEPGETSYVNSHVAEVIAGPASQITYGFLSQLKKGPTHFVTRRAQVGQDGLVEFIGGDIGDGFTIALLECHLKGTGSKASTRMIGLGYGRQRLDLTASMVHYGRYSESNIQLHGVLRDRANSLYRSSTQIVEGAVAAGSEQSDRMLMLDGSARADAIPMLLIDENDVQRCGHAASVGKLDPNQIYYLMSRGIPERDAKRMIVWGYLQPTLHAMPVPATRNLATRLIDEVLV